MSKWDVHANGDITLAHRGHLLNGVELILESDLKRYFVSSFVCSIANDYARRDADRRDEGADCISQKDKGIISTSFFVIF